MKSQLYSLLKFLVGFPLTLVALFFIIKTIATQAPTLSNNLHSIHIFLLLYGILSFIIFYFIRSYIWYQILKLYKYTIPFHESCYLWSISEVKRYIPGNVWSFLGRTILFEKKGVEKKDIGKGLIIEAELFVIGSFIISLLALSFYFTHKQVEEKTIFELLILVGTIIFCCGRKIFKKLPKLLSFLFSQFSIIENTFLVFLSIVALFFFGLGNYFVIDSAVYLNPKLFLELIGVFDFAFVIGYLSIITPAGFGVREGIVIVSLAKNISSGLAAFGALFSRIILICSEVLFIAITFIWHISQKNKFVKHWQKILLEHPQISILTVLVIIYILYFTIVSFLRYDNYYTGRFDLGNMAQTVWNTLHGKIFLFTNPNGTDEISRLAFHADFILILLAPIYALWQNPQMLLLIQTIVVSIGAFFVYLISRDVLKSRNLALAISFAFLINPSVERANIFDFHAVTLATTLFLATYYFLLEKRYKLFFVFAILAALCKEELWLIIALFGFLVFFVHKKRILGSLLFICGVGMFYYLLWYAIPQALGSQHFALAYFSDFGDSPTKVIKGILLSPVKTFQTILEPSRLGYLNQLFLPVGYLFLFFPFFLIFAGPDLVIDLLSNNPQLHQIYYQYTTTITPFIFLSVIYGIFWARKINIPQFQIKQTFWNPFFIIYILFFSLYTAYAFGPLPGAKDPNLDMFIKQLPDRVYIDNFLDSIPKKDSVASSNDIGSHLSMRENIYIVPYGLDRADIIVLLITDKQTKAAYNTVSKDPHYKKVASKDNFVAFQRI